MRKTDFTCRDNCQIFDFRVKEQSIVQEDSSVSKTKKKAPSDDIQVRQIYLYFVNINSDY